MITTPSGSPHSPQATILTSSTQRSHRDLLLPPAPAPRSLLPPLPGAHADPSPEPPPTPLIQPTLSSRCAHLQQKLPRLRGTAQASLLWSPAHSPHVERTVPVTECLRRARHLPALCNARGVLLTVLVGTLIPTVKMRKLRNRGIEPQLHPHLGISGSSLQRPVPSLSRGSREHERGERTL